MNDLKIILKERGKRYGGFERHAEISQELKRLINVYSNPSLFKPYQKEAMCMIMHKIARILNGDPSYADSWQDIAGYAQLVVDELTKKSE